jgi:hypothetical protein
MIKNHNGSGGTSCQFNLDKQGINKIFRMVGCREFSHLQIPFRNKIILVLADEGVLI